MKNRDSFYPFFDQVAKVVGVSDDLQTVAQCEADIQQRFKDLANCQVTEGVSAARSQPYYLDVTHPQANKGAVADRLSQLLAVPRKEIATIGDMPNDVPMFKRSGLNIAMGNASIEVQKQTDYVTTSYEEEGFANALEQSILERRAADPSQNRLRSTD